MNYRQMKLVLDNMHSLKHKTIVHYPDNKIRCFDSLFNAYTEGNISNLDVCCVCVMDSLFDDDNKVIEIFTE